jgi:lysophospholipase L1-like esterase
MKYITIPCLAMMFLTPVFAGNDKNYTYLALGDSVPFGMNITLLPPYSQQIPTPAQFVGYPETVAAVTHLLEANKEVNASCPGETSGSFLNTSAPDNGCNSPHYQPVGPPIPPFKTAIGLHTPYTIAQMDFAEAQLASNKHINLVTLSIGANDVLMALPAIEQCPDDACVTAVITPVLQAYGANLAQILTRIRAQYQGTLVVMTYYSPLPALDGLTMHVNSTMKTVASNFGVSIADGFAAFQLASALFGGDACHAGLLIKLPPSPPPPTPCDVHPSPMGRDLLAATVIVAAGKK